MCLETRKEMVEFHGKTAITGKEFSGEERLNRVSIFNTMQGGYCVEIVDFLYFFGCFLRPCDLFCFVVRRIGIFRSSFFKILGFWLWKMMPLLFPR